MKEWTTVVNEGWLYMQLYGIKRALYYFEIVLIAGKKLNNLCCMNDTSLLTKNKKELTPFSQPVAKQFIALSIYIKPINDW